MSSCNQKKLRLIEKSSIQNGRRENANKLNTLVRDNVMAYYKSAVLVYYFPLFMTGCLYRAVKE